MNTEVVSSDKELKETPRSFYSGEWEREEPQSRPNIGVAIRTVDSYFAVGCLVETDFQAFNDDCAGSQASEAHAKWRK